MRYTTFHELSREDGIYVLKLDIATLDAGNNWRFRREMEIYLSSLSKPVRGVVLDFGSVTSLDSDGLGAIIEQCGVLWDYHEARLSALGLFRLIFDKANDQHLAD